MKLLIGLLAVGLFAQNSSVLNNQKCKGNSVQIAASIPVSVGANLVSVPVCVALGTGLTIDTSVSPPRLNAVAPVIVPRIVIQRLTFITDAPQQPITYNLNYTPVGAIIISFKSSRIGGDVVDFLEPVADSNSKQVVVTLPEYRPFTTSDSLTVMYWTTDAP